jgi:hypothetical protein
MSDRWRDKKGEPGFKYHAWMRTVDELEDQIAELVEALKPFADAHFYYSDAGKPDDCRTSIGGVTYGDFRRAVSVLSKAEAQS